MLPVVEARRGGGKYSAHDARAVVPFVLPTFEGKHKPFPVLDTFRALGKTEMERVQGFAYDALIRQSEPAQNAVYAALETFAAVIGSVHSGVGEEATRLDFGLSPAQYARYLAAWDAVRGLKEEADAACFERGGLEGGAAR